jgi:hypothetical protein
MRSLRTLSARIRGIFGGATSDDDVRDELESHIHMQAAEYVRRGMHPAEARRQALARSGGLTVARELFATSEDCRCWRASVPTFAMRFAHSVVRRPTRSSRSRRSHSASERIPQSSAW